MIPPKMIQLFRYLTKAVSLETALILACLGTSKGFADSIYWTNAAGGLFSAVSNWSPNTVPLASDTLLFTNVGTYSFTVDAATTNSAAFFQAGSVTQAIPGSVWLLTNEWRVGETAGITSRVTSVSGSLIVTNQLGSAVLSVGRAGIGELAIRGGSVVADLLQATNGTNSILTFGNGDLTTFRGVTVSNANKLTLATTTNNQFVWNIFGGTNRILTPQFDYGGLTLGASTGNRQAKINLSGSNTLLSVPGLDTYGGNEIKISGGAKFRTYSVQLGLQTGGASNIVVISDPGSSWVNDYLIYFGMHAGSQTLIITNGGYFKTGGTTFGDQHFTALDNFSNRIIITGSNSWFNSDGAADIGIIFGSPIRNLDNLILVTNGGKFWARQLTYGSSGTFPGTLLNVADGSLWIGSLTFAVGTLRVENGNGTIDQLNMTGGTNAVIQTLGNLYVGHHGDLGSGELRIGGANTTIASLNGQLQVGGLQIGVPAGDNGNVTMTGGRAFVTNAAQTASLVIGSAGSGTLRVNNGFVQADSANVAGSGLLVLNGNFSSLLTRDLFIGPGGTTVVSNSATLQISNCVAASGAVLISGATLQFPTVAPAIPSNAIITSNAVISFTGVNPAPVNLSDPQYLGRIQRFGRTTLQLNQSTNAFVNTLVFDTNSASNWSDVILYGGINSLQAGSFLIESNSLLLASNTTSSVFGSLTNRGQIIVQNSTLRFVNRVTLTSSASLQGFQGIIIFEGGLDLPANDIVVPSGIIVRTSAISSQGGNLIINGGSVVPAEDGTVPSGIVVQNGWVTYFDKASAPTIPPVGLVWSGWLGLELIRSTNALVSSQSFTAGNGGYERLRLGSAGRWNSQQLIIGAGGQFRYADTSAILSPGTLRVENGGIFFEDTGAMSCIPFGVTISGAPSSWITANAICVGTSLIPFRVDAGGKIFSNTGTISGSGANVTLNGTGSVWFATNGVTLSGSSQLMVQTGAVFIGSQIVASGTSASVVLAGPDAIANSTNFTLSGSFANLQITDGATLISSNGTLGSSFSQNSYAIISGDGSAWRIAGSLALTAPTFSGPENLIIITNKGCVVAPSIALNAGFGFGRSALLLQGGNVFVTNGTGTASLLVNGRLDLNRGLLRADVLTAGSTSSSSLNIQAGSAEWRSSDFVSGIPLRIGNSTNLASLKLLGGTNVLRSGLEIRRHATLAGNGVIAGVVTNRGTIQPAALTVRSNLFLDATSEIVFAINAPPGSTQNSSLVVTGSISLAGKLSISLAQGVVPSNTQTYILLSHGGISSTFSNVAFGQRLLTRDQLGSFRIDNNGSNITATDFQSEDHDGDGINDNWALQYFGSTPFQPGTGTNNLDGDLDGDGLSNRNEFFLNTNPADAQSTLRVTAEMGAGQSVRIRFPFIFGHSYFLNISENLSNWTEVPMEDFQFDQNGLAVWTEQSNLITGRYYRLIIR